MSTCPHYLEMPTGDPDALPQLFECEKELNHPGRHKDWSNGQGVGPRPMGGKARKPVQVWVEWER